jgi:hypothetical protein
MVKVILVIAAMLIQSSLCAQFVHKKIMVARGSFVPSKIVRIRNLNNFLKSYAKNENRFISKYCKISDSNLLQSIKVDNYKLDTLLKVKEEQRLKKIIANSYFYYCGSKNFNNNVTYHFFMEKILFKSGNVLTDMYSLRSSLNSTNYYFKCATNKGDFIRDIKIRKFKITIKDRKPMCARYKNQLWAKNCYVKKKYFIYP